MNEIEISTRLKNSYSNYYAYGESEWRRIGAISKADNILSLCKELPSNSVLEIGAGDGSIMSRLSELNFGQKLYALEISTSGVDVIEKRNIPRLVEAKLFDGYQIPYESNSFDIAILSHVIEHVEHPRQLLHEAARVAQNVFVEVPLEDNLRLSKTFTLDKVGHINFYSSRTFTFLIQSCGFQVLKGIVTSSSKETYSFREGFKGVIKYYIACTILKMMPSLATKLFTYNGSLVYRKNE